MDGRRAAAFCFILVNATSIAQQVEPADLVREADRYADVGNWAAAREPYARAEEAFRRRGDQRNELYAKLGRLHRDVETGSYSSALREVEADLANPVVQNDPPLKIRALSLKGTIDLNLNTAAAKDDYSQILDLAKATGDAKWENRAAGELGIVAGVNGDLGTAGVALFGAINRAAELHDVAGQVNFSIWLANGMAVNGMSDRALKVLDRAVEAARKAPSVGIPIQLDIARIRALINLPEGPQRENGMQQAQTLIEEAMVSARKNNTLGAQAELLNQSGLIAQKKGDFPTAAKYFSETAKVAETAALPRMRAEALYSAATLYRTQRSFVQASAAIDKAILEQQKAQEPFDLPLYLAEKAAIESGLHHPARANALYEQGTALTESMLVRAPSSRVKSSMIATMSGVYLGHFRLALKTMNSPAKAFDIVESARGRALADTLLSNRVPAHSNTPADLELSRVQAQLRQPSNTPADVKRLQIRLDQAYAALVPLEYSRDRAEVSRVSRPVSLKAVQTDVRADEALIEYVLMDEGQSYAFEITRANVAVHDLAPRREIEAAAQKYVKAIRSKEDASNAAKALFQLVIAPAVTGRSTAVTIIPDGILHMVPFAALQEPGGRYWLSSVQISTAPSATVFHRLRSGHLQTAGLKSFLGIAFSPEGNPQQRSLISSSRAVSVGEHPIDLKPLPYAQQELASAANVFGAGSVLLEGKQASESAVHHVGLENFKIIHIAAHGITDLVEPDRAGLVLASGSSSDDGFWQAREIRRTRIEAELVTLSACDTGTGRLQGEEGIMNLARSFLTAGAKSVVASLWEVDDRSTATLMGHFYRHIALGQTVAQSLRQAQTEILTEFGSETKPYFWSAFTVIGDGARKITPQAGATKSATADKNIR
jgi:CHAT domain-containing protein